MLAAVLRGANDVRLEEWPTPVISEGEMLVKLLACGICGTDVHKAAHLTVTVPSVLGHEICGRVVETGAGVTRFKAGDRVAFTHHTPCFSCDYCRRGNYTMCQTWRRSNLDPGGFAEYIRVPAAQTQHNTFLVPDQLANAAACHLEPLACIVRGFNRAPIHPGDTVLIIGAGPIGLLHVQVARYYMAGTIIVADISEYRLQQAKRFGADVVMNNGAVNLLDEVRALTGGRGANLVVISAPAPQLLTQAIELADKGGTVLVFALIDSAQVPINARRLVNDEVRLLGSYSSGPADLEQAFHLLRTGAIRADDMVTHTVGLGGVGDGIKLLQTPGAEVIKIVVTGEGS